MSNDEKGRVEAAQPLATLPRHDMPRDRADQAWETIAQEFVRAHEEARASRPVEPAPPDSTPAPGSTLAPGTGRAWKDALVRLWRRALEPAFVAAVSAAHLAWAFAQIAAILDN